MRPVRRKIAQVAASVAAAAVVASAAAAVVAVSVVAAVAIAIAATVGTKTNVFNENGFRGTRLLRSFVLFYFCPACGQLSFAVILSEAENPAGASSCTKC